MKTLLLIHLILGLVFTKTLGQANDSLKTLAKEPIHKIIDSSNVNIKNNAFKKVIKYDNIQDSTIILLDADRFKNYLRQEYKGKTDYKEKIKWITNNLKGDTIYLLDTWELPYNGFEENFIIQEMKNGFIKVYDKTTEKWITDYFYLHSEFIWDNNSKSIDYNIQKNHKIFFSYHWVQSRLKKTEVLNKKK